MKSIHMNPTAIALSALLVLALASPFAAGEAAAAASSDEEMAAKLVNDCARIKEGDTVLVSGGANQADLLEAIAVNVRKAGAFPLITIGSERLIKRMWDDVPARYDTQVPTLGLKLASTFTAMIDLDFVETRGLTAYVPADRRAARAKAGEAVAVAMRKQNVRSLNLGNGLYPTEARAKELGITRQALATRFWQGVNTDYAKLQATGESVRAALAAGKNLHLTNPNGTDLKIVLQGNPVLVSDGVISDDDVKKGGAAVQVWLPAGEVYVAPAAGLAEGKVVVDQTFRNGTEITGLALVFKAGKLESMTAKSGLDALKADYDAAGAGKDVLGVIDVGINADMQGLKDAWMPAGMVSLTIGDNTWAGGTNQTNFDLSMHLAGSTLTVDGKTLVDAGKLK